MQFTSVVLPTPKRSPSEITGATVIGTARALPKNFVNRDYIDGSAAILLEKVDTANMTVPAHVPESPLETYTTSLDVAKWVLATVEGLGDDIVSLHDPLWLVAEHTAGRENPPVWLNALVTQLTNELLDLLHEAVAARGRPAVKSARSLFDLTRLRA
jgi:hypothetical protein